MYDGKRPSLCERIIVDSGVTDSGDWRSRPVWCLAGLLRVAGARCQRDSAAPPPASNYSTPVDIDNSSSVQSSVSTLISFVTNYTSTTTARTRFTDDICRYVRVHCTCNVSPGIGSWCLSPEVRGYGNWNFRSHVLSLPGNESSTHRTFVPWNFRSRERK